jgi:L-cystine transport system substrate-binding protein
MKKGKDLAVRAYAAVLILAAVLSGAYAKDKKNSDVGKVKTIIVGTGNAFKPYCYLDDNGNLKGYEKDVLDAVDALLPQYKFEYETFTFKDILIALSAGKIDLGAHQFEINPERQKNYLFTDETYTSFILYVTVLNKNTTINGIDDLAGKTVLAMVGDNGTYVLEQYNKNHPDKTIKLNYLSSPPREQVVAGMQNGTWDAFISLKREVAQYNKEYNVGFKVVGKPIATSYTYYVFAKGNTELKTAVDGALKQLKKSGELSKLSIQDLGADYTQSE